MSSEDFSTTTEEEDRFPVSSEEWDGESGTSTGAGSEEDNQDDEPVGKLRKKKTASTSQSDDLEAELEAEFAGSEFSELSEASEDSEELSGPKPTKKPKSKKKEPKEQKEPKKIVKPIKVAPVILEKFPGQTTVQTKKAKEIAKIVANSYKNVTQQENLVRSTVNYSVLNSRYYGETNEKAESILEKIK